MLLVERDQDQGDDFQCIWARDQHLQWCLRLWCTCWTQFEQNSQDSWHLHTIDYNNRVEGCEHDVLHPWILPHFPPWWKRTWAGNSSVAFPCRWSLRRPGPIKSTSSCLYLLAAPLPLWHQAVDLLASPAVFVAEKMKVSRYRHFCVFSPTKHEHTHKHRHTDTCTLSCKLP